MRKSVLMLFFLVIISGCSWNQVADLVKDIQEVQATLEAIATDDTVQKDVQTILARVPALAANPASVPDWAGVAAGLVALVGSVSYAARKSKTEAQKAVQNGKK